MNSMSEYFDSDDLARFGCFLFTGGMVKPLCPILFIQSRDNCHFSLSSRYEVLYVAAMYSVPFAVAGMKVEVKRRVLRPRRRNSLISEGGCVALAAARPWATRLFVSMSHVH